MDRLSVKLDDYEEIKMDDSEMMLSNKHDDFDVTSNGSVSLR